jgi:hypothetical protein
MPDELTLPAEQPATESNPAEPLPQPLDVEAFQRVLAQHDPPLVLTSRACWSSAVAGLS